MANQGAKKQKIKNEKEIKKLQVGTLSVLVSRIAHDFVSTVLRRRFTSSIESCFTIQHSHTGIGLDLLFHVCAIMLAMVQSVR